MNLFKLISEQEIYTIFGRLKSKAAGIDCITYDMLLFSLDYIAKPLCKLFNQCILTGDFPEEWKIALVHPLPKNSRITFYGELRPINKLPILAKMFEIAIADRVNDFLTDRTILPEIQSGFRTKHSTATALCKVSTDISVSLDNSQVSCLMLLDYTKA